MTSAQDSLIGVFGTRMCGQTLLIIVIANCQNLVVSSVGHVPRYQRFLWKSGMQFLHILL